MVDQIKLDKLVGFLNRLSDKECAEWYLHDKRTLLQIIREWKKQKHVLTRLSVWPTKTQLQTSKQLILKAREVAKIGLGLRR
jgi:hypothetical protein